MTAEVLSGCIFPSLVVVNRDSVALKPLINSLYKRGFAILDFSDLEKNFSSQLKALLTTFGEKYGILDSFLSSACLGSPTTSSRLSFEDLRLQGIRMESLTMGCSFPRFFESDDDEGKVSKAGKLREEVLPDLVGYVSGKNRERLELRWNGRGEASPVGVPEELKDIATTVVGVLDLFAVTLLYHLCGSLPGRSNHENEELQKHSLDTLGRPNREDALDSSLLRLSYYRDTTGKENHDQEKLLPHIDAGFITLVPVSDVPGLQVLDNDSFEWVKIEEVAKSSWVVVMIGDALSFLTGGYYRATLHTVVNEHPKRRLSTVYLLRPSHDRTLKSLKYVELSAQQLFERLTSINYKHNRLSRDMLPIIKRFAKRFQTIPGITGILLEGTIARGFADEFSCDKLRIFATSGIKFTDLWASITTAITEDEFTILWRSDQFFSLSLSFDKIKLTLELNILEDYKNWIRQGASEVSEPLNAMLYDLKYCEIFFDPLGEIDNIRSLACHYSPEVGSAILSYALSCIPPKPVMSDLLEFRSEKKPNSDYRLQMRKTLDTTIDALIKILLVLNGEYQSRETPSTEELKRILCRRPKNFFRRLFQGLTGNLRDSHPRDEFLQLISDVVSLVPDSYPNFTSHHAVLGWISKTNMYLLKSNPHTHKTYSLMPLNSHAGKVIQSAEWLADDTDSDFLDAKLNQKPISE